MNDHLASRQRLGDNGDYVVNIFKRHGDTRQTWRHTDSPPFFRGMGTERGTGRMGSIGTRIAQIGGQEKQLCAMYKKTSPAMVPAGEV